MAILLTMMIHFAHHFNHRQDRMMTHQMRICTHHRMSHQVYCHIPHLHQIIHNYRFPEPIHTSCARHCDSAKRHHTTRYWGYTRDSQYKETSWWSTDTTCYSGSTIANACPALSSSQFHPSNHLGGDTQPSGTPNATTQPVAVAPGVSNAKKPPDNPKDFADLMTLMIMSLIQMQVHQGIMVDRYFR